MEYAVLGSADVNIINHAHQQLHEHDTRTMRREQKSSAEHRGFMMAALLFKLAMDVRHALDEAQEGSGVRQRSFCMSGRTAIVDRPARPFRS